MLISAFRHTNQVFFPFNKLGYRKHFQLIGNIRDNSLSQKKMLDFQPTKGTRKFSSKVSSNNLEEELNDEIKNALPLYQKFLKLDVQEKIKISIEMLLDKILIDNKLNDHCKDQFFDKWVLVQKTLSSKGDIFNKFDDFDLKKIISGEDGTSLALLLAAQKKIISYKAPIHLDPTEKYWSMHSPTFPCTETNNENLTAIKELILPNLKNKMIVREMGCWNGESLINLAFAACEQNIQLGGLFGLDLNKGALQLGMAFLHYLKIKQIILGIGNIKDESFFIDSLQTKKQMVLAFRLIPVLDENSIESLFFNLHKNTKTGDLICFSYALPSGNNYEKVILYSENQQLGVKTQAHSNGKGITAYHNEVIFQTYLHLKDYEGILRRHQFEQIDFKVVDSRAVSLARRMS